MTTIEIVQQSGQFDASISQILICVISAFLAMVLILGAVGAEKPGPSKKVFIGSLLSLIILTAITLNYNLYVVQKDQEEAVRLIDSVLDGGNRVVEAIYLNGKIVFRIQTKETVLLGTQVSYNAGRVILTLEGAEKLNEIYLRKHGVAMIPTQIP